MKSTDKTPQKTLRSGRSASRCYLCGKVPDWYSYKKTYRSRIGIEWDGSLEHFDCENDFYLHGEKPSVIDVWEKQNILG
jgi:hypothetical protein